jgi:hypothetical protein
MWVSIIIWVRLMLLQMRSAKRNIAMPWQLGNYHQNCAEFEELSLEFVNELSAATMQVDSTLGADIRKGQLEDAKIQEIK